MIVLSIYCVAHWRHCRRIPFIPRLLKSFNRIVFAVVPPPSAQIGKEVLLSYEGLGTVIHRRAIIGDGAIIGTGATIGANAVVLHDVPEYLVAVGIPARIVGINQPQYIPDYKAFQEGR